MTRYFHFGSIFKNCARLLCLNFSSLYSWNLILVFKKQMEKIQPINAINIIFSRPLLRIGMYTKSWKWGIISEGIFFRHITKCGKSPWLSQTCFFLFYYRDSLVEWPLIGNFETGKKSRWFPTFFWRWDRKNTLRDYPPFSRFWIHTYVFLVEACWKWYSLH